MELVMYTLGLRGFVLCFVLVAGCSTGPSGELRTGWELMTAANYSGARAHYEGMLSEYPENPYVHLNLGVAYHQLGNLEAARKHYEAAVTYGGNAEVSRVLEQGDVKPTKTTIADKARENLALIP